MKCVKFKDGLKHELRKEMKILEFFYFPTHIPSVDFLKVLKLVKIIYQNISQPNKKMHNEGKPYGHLQ